MLFHITSSLFIMLIYQGVLCRPYGMFLWWAGLADSIPRCRYCTDVLACMQESAMLTFQTVAFSMLFGPFFHTQTQFQLTESRVLGKSFQGGDFSESLLTVLMCRQEKEHLACDISCNSGYGQNSAGATLAKRTFCISTHNNTVTPLLPFP